MRNWSRTIGISGTLIIHLSLLLQFIVIPVLKKPPPPPPPGNQQEVEVTLLPPVEHKSIILPPIDAPAEIIAQVDPDICKNQSDSYMGVGFKYSPFTALIIHVPEYYPAYRAGIRLGDMILDPDTPIVNGYLDIEIMRGYQQMHFRIKAEKICFKPKLTTSGK